MGCPNFYPSDPDGSQRPGRSPNIVPDGTDIGNLWHEWGEPVFSDGNRTMETQVIYHYYYKPERAYGCRLCAQNKNGITFCSPFNADFPNETPVDEGSEKCQGKALRSDPILRKEDRPQGMKGPADALYTNYINALAGSGRTLGRSLVGAGKKVVDMVSPF